MAIGDLATAISVTGNLAIQVTFTCPQDGTINTTPTVNKPVTTAGVGEIFGAVTCTGCGRRLLIDLSGEAFAVRIQQVSV